MSAAYGCRPLPARQSRTTTTAHPAASAAQMTVRTTAVMSAAMLAVYGRGGPAKVRHMATSSLVVKATAGKNDPERCNQALTVAAAAVASGVPVSLWLTGEAAWLAVPGQGDQITLPHATPAADLLAVVLAAGTVTVCTQCAARREITEDALIEGIRIAGAPTFVAEVLADGAKPLVY